MNAVSRMLDVTVLPLDVRKMLCLAHCDGLTLWSVSRGSIVYQTVLLSGDVLCCLCVHPSGSAAESACGAVNQYGARPRHD